jgi:predicted RND superfamily exporter protein
MEAEFVNIFIEKQREVLVDLTSRNIMLEARVLFAEQKLQKMIDLAQELQANQEHVKQLLDINKLIEEEKRKLAASEIRLKNQLVEKDAELTTKNKQSSDQLAEKAKEVDHLRNKVNECKVDADQLRNEVKKLNLEKEVNEAKTIRLRNKAKQLSEE